MTDKTRKAFESEILKNKAAFGIIRVASGEYQSRSTQELWEYWQAATAAERERCALVCEKLPNPGYWGEGNDEQDYADAIRQGGEA